MSVVYLKVRRAVLLMLALHMPVPLFAAEPDSLEVSAAYVYLPIPGQTTASGYFIMKNPSSRDAVLVSASSPEAQRIEIHHHIHVDGMMQMRQLSALPVPAGEQVVLEPGSLHLMLFGFSRSVVAGDEVTLYLSLDKGQPITVVAGVRDRLADDTASYLLKGKGK